MNRFAKFLISCGALVAPLVLVAVRRSPGPSIRVRESIRRPAAGPHRGLRHCRASVPRWYEAASAPAIGVPSPMTVFPAAATVEVAQCPQPARLTPVSASGPVPAPIASSPPPSLVPTAATVGRSSPSPESRYPTSAPAASATPASLACPSRSPVACAPTVPATGPTVPMVARPAPVPCAPAPCERAMPRPVAFPDTRVPAVVAALRARVCVSSACTPACPQASPPCAPTYACPRPYPVSAELRRRLAPPPASEPPRREAGYDAAGSRPGLSRFTIVDRTAAPPS